jgi:ribonuclease P protein component
MGAGADRIPRIVSPIQRWDMPDEKYPRRRRLRGKLNFDHVIAEGATAADDVLVVTAAPNHLPITRLGVSIPRLTGHSPARNRWKRVIREAFRRSTADLPAGLDLVVRPRRGGVCDYRRVRMSLASLCRRVQRKLAAEATSRSRTTTSTSPPPQPPPPTGPSANP